MQALLHALNVPSKLRQEVDLVPVGIRVLSRRDLFQHRLLEYIQVLHRPLQHRVKLLALVMQSVVLDECDLILAVQKGEPFFVDVLIDFRI